MRIVVIGGVAPSINADWLYATGSGCLPVGRLASILRGRCISCGAWKRKSWPLVHQEDVCDPVVRQMEPSNNFWSCSQEPSRNRTGRASGTLAACRWSVPILPMRKISNF